MTDKDLEKIAIVLGDAVPYELWMLEAAAQYMEEDSFRSLNLKVGRDAFFHNATIEAFWTHARCLIEFFARNKNDNYDVSAASARDFTRDD